MLSSKDWPSLEKYILKCPKDLIIESRRVLFEEVGTLELCNQNDGKSVEKYQKELELPKSSPYCVAGQFYCFAEAMRRLKLPRHAIPLCRTGLSLRLLQCARAKGWAVKPSPALDDIIVWAKRYSFGHVERIVAVFRRGWVETIGFDTRKFNKITKKFDEGVFRFRRNINHTFSTFRLVGFIGYEGD
ncbi:MAG: hypothetical protein ACUVQ1_08530 [Candidatus Kapaibacteriales bacterium]